MKQIIELFRGTWRALNGGWFVWRDASYETVKYVAKTQLSDSDPDGLHEIVKQAKEELNSREQLSKYLTPKNSWHIIP
jgi:hypothetical protein